MKIAPMAKYALKTHFFNVIYFVIRYEQKKPGQNTCAGFC